MKFVTGKVNETVCARNEGSEQAKLIQMELHD